MKNRMFLSDSDSLDLQQLDQMRRDMEQRVRTHYQSRMVAVTVPFYQSLITGLLAGILVAILIYAFGGTNKYILIGFAVTWVVVTGIVWLLLLQNWRELVWNMEQQFGVDLTGDQVIGPPLAIQAEVSRNGGQSRHYADLSGSYLLRFFEAILAGEDISEARWTPARNGFSKSDYWSTISGLIRLGVLRWKNMDSHPQGVILTDDGEEILEQWIDEIDREQKPPPPPRG